LQPEEYESIAFAYQFPQSCARKQPAYPNFDPEALLRLVNSEQAESAAKRLAVHIKNIAANVFRDVDEKHIMAFAAALSYYFVLSVFPLLIFVSAVVAYLPVSSLFNQIVGVLATVVPPDSMAMVKKILAHVLLSRHGGLLTFGIVFTIWSASSGFAAMIEALNVTYNVPETRRIWTTRALAVGLAFLVGTLLVTALLVLIAGPKFGGWLAGTVGLSPAFAAIWPYLQWSVATGFTVIAVELLYAIMPPRSCSQFGNVPA